MRLEPSAALDGGQGGGIGSYARLSMKVQVVAVVTGGNHDCCQLLRRAPMLGTTTSKRREWISYDVWPSQLPDLFLRRVEAELLGSISRTHRWFPCSSLLPRGGRCIQERQDGPLDSNARRVPAANQWRTAVVAPIEEAARISNYPIRVLLPSAYKPLSRRMQPRRSVRTHRHPPSVTR